MIGLLTLGAIALLALRNKRGVSGIGKLSRLEWNLYSDLIHTIENEVLSYIESSDYDPYYDHIAPSDKPRLDISVSPTSRTGYDFEVTVDEAKYFQYPEKTYDLLPLITEHEDGYLTVDYEELEHVVMDFLDRQLGRDVAGIGAVQRVKRRIYKEIAAAQGKGVNFDKKYQDTTPQEVDALFEVGTMFGWQQTKRSRESGKSYEEAYFNSLKRAYNAISGIGIGASDYKTHTIRNGDGKIILQWREYDSVAEHLQQEPIVEIIEQTVSPNKLTQQEKILQAWPHLKVYHNEKVFYPNTPELHPFQYVAWNKMLDSQGEPLYEGAMMAFVTEGEAKDWVNKYKRDRDLKNSGGYFGGGISVKHIKNIKPEQYL